MGYNNDLVESIIFRKPSRRKKDRQDEIERLKEIHAQSLDAMLCFGMFAG